MLAATWCCSSPVSPLRWKADGAKPGCPFSANAWRCQHLPWRPCPKKTALIASDPPHWNYIFHTSTSGETDGWVSSASLLLTRLTCWCSGCHSLPVGNLHSLQPQYCGAPSQPAAADITDLVMLFVLILFIFKLLHHPARYWCCAAADEWLQWW